MKSAIGLVVLAATIGAASGCSGDSSTSPITTPSPSLLTDTFPGTVPVLGNDLHTFIATQAGEIDVTLVAAGPPATISMGLAIGSLAAPGSNTCVPISNGAVSAQAGTAPQLTGAIAAGSYCVMVFDIGNETEPVTYTVTVMHP